MSSVNTSCTEISTDCQNRNDTTATTSSSDVMEMSPKQLQVITFLSKTEMVLENCLKEEQSSDYKELQNIIKNLAIILKNGEKETKQYVKEALNKDDNKILFLLDKIAFHLFKASVMQGISLTPQHPLILAYYCIGLIKPTEKFVKVGIIYPIVHHLKVMELFMTLAEEDLTLAKLLMSILCSCCVLESALTIMVHSRLHHVLAYYIHMFEFNTILQAKSALAIIVNKVEEHFQQFVKLTDKELSNVHGVLATCVKTKNLYVKLMDRQGSSDYHIVGFLEMLRHLTSNPDNMMALGSSTFIELYHSMLLEPDLSGAAKEVLLLLEVVCGHPANKKAVHGENGQLLATLETLTANEDLQSKAIEVIWKLLNEDTVAEIKPSATVNDSSDIKEDKIASALKHLLDAVKVFFLKNKTASQITEMKFYEVKTLFAEIFCFLRYLMALSEHFTITVIEKCSDEIQSTLQVISDYCLWMICREKLLDKSEWSVMHPLYLFHFFFYFIINISDHGKKQLKDSGVLKLIIKELWMIQLIPNWHKGISKLAQLILIILLKCFEFVPQGLMHAGLLEQFCIEEEFLFRICAKPLLAAFSEQNAFNFKLVELLESEALTILNLLETSSNNPKKVIPVTSSIKDCIVLHVSFPEVEFIISSYLKGNPANQKVFYDCCVQKIVDVLDNTHPSVQSRVENLIALIMSENLPETLISPPIAGLDGSLCKAEEYGQLLYWVCCVSNSMRMILSDQVDDNLTEHYVPFEEDALFVVGQKDLLFNDLFQLTDMSTTQQGIKAFHLFLLQMPQFSILLKSLLKLSFKRILENNSTVNIPASSCLRLERIFSLLQDHCQKSPQFCTTIAHGGIITDLIDALLVLYACQSYRSIDFEWILLHLAEPILYVLAVCAENESLHGYLRYLPNLLEFYCKVNFLRCGALSKIILSIMCKSTHIAPAKFEMSDTEVNFVHELLSSAIYKQENEDYTWIAYTTDTNDSVYCFVTFCLHLVSNPSNGMKLVKAGVLDCISFLFQRYKQESLLKNALRLLAKLSMLPKVSAEISESHYNMINTTQQLLQKDSMKVDVFYSLIALGINVPKIADLPDGYIDALVMFRIGEYHSCASKLQEMINDKEKSPVQVEMKQTLGESFYKLHALEFSSANQSKHSVKAGRNNEYYKNAKQAIKYLGIAYDHQLFGNEDVNSMHLDLVVMDCIFNIRDKGALSRCLLCRRKCGQGEKLIRSHIWPNALLRHLSGRRCDDSKKVFDASWKGIGQLHGPGQIYFTMLCKACENLFSKYEKAFKSLCFDKLYCDASEDTKQSLVGSHEVVMTTMKAPGVPNRWLYLFCLSIAFRMFVVASQGCPTNIGNFKSWYDSFAMWREILLKEGSIQGKTAPKVALFVAPVNVLEELSPSMAKVLFSPGVGAFCDYRLHDGVSISSSKEEFLLSSIGVINIVVSYDEACFDFIPSECIVTLDSPEFVIPSAVRRYLLFPKGIWREYINIAAIITERMLNIPQGKVVAINQKQLWIGEEIKLFSDVLGESFGTSDVHINFLPTPFNRGQGLQQITAILKSCAMFKTILHVKENETDICDDWFNTFIVRNENQPGLPELFAILIFQNKSYVISVAYKLLPTDLSAADVIQESSTKAFFPQIESYFKIRTLLQAQLMKAITKAGFTDMTLFVNWLREFKSSCYCDLRCFPYCFACYEICSCCMRTVSIADAIPVYYDAKLEAKVAIVCGPQCLSYLTSTSSLPVILYTPKENTMVSQLALQVCTNGVLFGFTGIKGKFIIYYFTSEGSDRITVWCQYRLWCTQYIYTILFDGSFNVVNDYPISAGFAELFADSEGRKKFTQFVKDVWHHYQSLLIKTVTVDDKKYQQNDQMTSQADQGFEYFATMPTDQLSFHVPQEHVQSHENDQSGQGNNNNNNN